MAEKDMDIIRSKRATNAGVLNAGQPKGKYRKRSVSVILQALFLFLTLSVSSSLSPLLISHFGPNVHTSFIKLIFDVTQTKFTLTNCLASHPHFERTNVD